MIQTLAAYLLVAFVIVSAYPWAAWLLKSTSPVFTSVLMLALSIGALTLVMLWEGLLGIPFSIPGITLPYLLIMLLGVVLWWRGRGAVLDVGAGLRSAPTDNASSTPMLKRSRWANLIQRLPLLLLVAVSAAILFNAVYWPFHRDDALGIYQPHARAMYELRGLLPLTGADSLYLTYPMLIPSAYAYAYLASGWENEYLANLLGALLSVGCLPVAYWLGALLKDKRAGWLSAVLLATTPAFGRWASAGYVDLPMAFFYALSGIFAIRLWRGRRWQDALLAGAMMGLAAWTKNAALIGVPLLMLWLLWALVHRRIGVSLAGLAILACAIVAAPWYLRNLAGAGFIVPDTAWTDQAQRTLDNLLVFITRFENFGLTGWLAVLGTTFAVSIIVRRRGNAPEYLLHLLWTLPFFGAWWLFVSYDPRFLLLFLPPLCALGGALLTEAWTKIPARWRPRVQVVIALVAAVLTIQALWFSVEYKDELLRSPLMGDAEKQTIVGRR
jgi:4-amino-4-deoxy-L-arabinose transferase-like glycosyltransferase